jgi:hypothetical protein
MAQTSLATTCGLLGYGHQHYCPCCKAFSLHPRFSIGVLWAWQCCRCRFRARLRSVKVFGVECGPQAYQRPRTAPRATHEGCGVGATCDVPGCINGPPA